MADDNGLTVRKGLHVVNRNGQQQQRYPKRPREFGFPADFHRSSLQTSSPCSWERLTSEPSVFPFDNFRKLLYKNCHPVHLYAIRRKIVMKKVYFKSKHMKCKHILKQCP
jgi:hypothetical protein